MPDSPRKSVNSVDPSKKKNVEVSADVNVVESDRKVDSPLYENNLNLQSSSMLGTSNVDTKTPVTQSPENKLGLSADVSDTSKKENVGELQPLSSSDDKDGSSLVLSSTSPLLASNKESSIPSTISELTLTGQNLAEISHSLTPISSETANLDDSVLSTTIAEKTSIEFSKETDTLTLVSSEINNLESSISSTFSSEQSSTTPNDEIQFLPSKVQNFINDSNKESSILPSVLSEQLSAGIEKEIPTIPSSSSEMTRSEVSVPSPISSEQPIEPEGIQNLPTFSSKAANNERFQSTIPSAHSEIPISVSSTSETNSESFALSTIPSGQAEIPTSEINSTESSLQSSMPSEQLTRQLEIPLSVPSPSEVTNTESSIPSNIHSEQSAGLQAEISVSIATNKQCSSSLTTVISDVEALLSLPATSVALAEVSISEETEIAEKLLGVVNKIKTVFKDLKETETLLDRGYQSCHYNSKQLCRVTKIHECKCPGFTTLHSFAQETRLTISILFVQLQKIYNWFKHFENTDERFNDHMADIENLHKAVSDMLTRFNLGHW